MRRSLVVGGAAAVVAVHVGGALFFAERNPYETQVFAPCPVLTLTGWKCPGCGATRAAYSLLHGDIAGAFAMNPLLLAIYAMGLLLVGMTVAERLRRPRLARALMVAAIATPVSAALYTGVVRNLVG